MTDYTDSEYGQYLEDEHWTKQETDYLFDLCKTYDLRFYIIHDRWDSETHRVRTIDQLKDRYYKTVGTLQKIKQVDADVFVFDVEHEQKRREQLNKLLSRTAEQIKEEEFLVEELKKIEIRKRERDRKSQNLSQLLSVTTDAQSESPSNRQPQASTKSTVKSRKSSLNDSVSNLAPAELLNKEPKSTKKSLIFKVPW